MGKAKFETRVNRKKKRLDKVFSDLDEKRKAVAVGLIETAAFDRVTLEDLREDIAQNGDTELFAQGKTQEPYIRERPSSKKYDTRVASYQKTLKQLMEMLPKEKAAAIGDEFESF